MKPATSPAFSTHDDPDAATQRLRAFVQSLPDDVRAFVLGRPSGQRWLGLTVEDDRANHAALMTYLRLAYDIPARWKRITRSRGRAFTRSAEQALGLCRIQRGRPRTPRADRADVRVADRVAEIEARLAPVWDLRQRLRAEHQHDEEVIAALRQAGCSAGEATIVIAARTLTGAAGRIAAKELGLKNSSVRAAVSRASPLRHPNSR